ncbi:ZIP family metal transporter [Patescibacteria group bacterium]|nr:ZIP family metal transporter [Patescibacteria group bacterium]
MDSFFFTLLATLGIASLALSGSFLLFLKDHILKHISLYLLAMAAGALLGTAFLHLLPEVLEKGFPQQGFLVLLGGFLFFYIGEKLLHLHHGPQGVDEHNPRALGVLSLSADAMHNFIDGIILAVAFLVDVRLGMVTAAAVALHEIPQEIAEFGVLLYAGFSKRRALFLNFLSATTVILGGVVGFLFQEIFVAFIPFVLLFAAGSFIYIGASDFVPEFKKERNPKRALGLSFTFFFGIFLMWIFTFIE